MHRDQDQGDEGCEKHSEAERDGHGNQELRLCGLLEDERCEARECGQRGEQNGPKAHDAGGRDRAVRVIPSRRLRLT